MLFYVIGIVIFLYSLFDYKLGFILFLGFKYVLVQNITVISVPGLPLLTLDDLMLILMIALFVFNKRKLSCAKISFPWMTPFLLLSITWIISSFCSIAGITAEISLLFSNIIQEFILILMMWEILETSADFRRVLFLITVLTFLACLYGFYEYSIMDNPLREYEKTLNHDPAKIIDFSYSINSIRGYRVSSFFEHSIGFGINLAMYIVFIAVAYTQFGEKQVKKIPYVITTLVCIPGIILSKMRSGYFFLLIGIISCINIRKVRFYIILFISTVAVVLLWPLISSNLEAFISIFTGDNYGGSDASMRLDQLSAAINLAKQSPVFGLGEKFNTVYSNSLVDRLLGMESIWLKVIVSYGIFGVISYLILIIYSVYYIPRYFKCKSMRYIALSYWLTYSLTSLPGVHTYIYYLIMIYCIKNSNVYKRNIVQRDNEWRLSNGIIYYKKIFTKKPNTNKVSFDE